MREILEDYLFCTADWFAVAEQRKAQLIEEIRRFPEHQVMNTSVDDLCGYLIQKYSIDVPVLDEAKIHVDHQDVQIDVSRDPNRRITDRSRTFYVSGTSIEITIPFAGEERCSKYVRQRGQ